jgi:predicted ATPase
MIAQLTAGKALPAEVVQQMLAKTDGVPLFVEEVVKMLLESGLVREGADRYRLTGPLPPLATPTTSRDSLMARLDRLATVKEVAQLGATLGRTFSYDLMKAVSPSDEHTLQLALKQLIDAEPLYQRGVPPQATYVFKHTLIQEAAYQSLLPSTRQRFHGPALGTRSWSGLPSPRRHGPLVAGLSRPGLATKPRGTDPGAGAPAPI